MGMGTEVGAGVSAEVGEVVGLVAGMCRECVAEMWNVYLCPSPALLLLFPTFPFIPHFSLLFLSSSFLIPASIYNPRLPFLNSTLFVNLSLTLSIPGLNFPIPHLSNSLLTIPIFVFSNTASIYKFRFTFPNSNFFLSKPYFFLSLP